MNFVTVSPPNGDKLLSTLNYRINELCSFESSVNIRGTSPLVVPCVTCHRFQGPCLWIWANNHERLPPRSTKMSLSESLLPRGNLRNIFVQLGDFVWDSHRPHPPWSQAPPSDKFASSRSTWCWPGILTHQWTSFWICFFNCFFSPPTSGNIDFDTTIPNGTPGTQGIGCRKAATYEVLFSKVHDLFLIQHLSRERMVGKPGIAILKHVIDVDIDIDIDIWIRRQVSVGILYRNIYYYLELRYLKPHRNTMKCVICITFKCNMIIQNHSKRVAALPWMEQHAKSQSGWRLKADPLHLVGLRNPKPFGINDLATLED